MFKGDGMTEYDGEAYCDGYLDALVSVSNMLADRDLETDPPMQTGSCQTFSPRL